MTNRQIFLDTKLDTSSKPRDGNPEFPVNILRKAIHDLNNSLSVALGNISLSKLEVDHDEEVYNYLNEAEQAVLKANDLVRKLQMLSRESES